MIPSRLQQKRSPRRSIESFGASTRRRLGAPWRRALLLAIALPAVLPIGCGGDLEPAAPSAISADFRATTPLTLPYRLPPPGIERNDTRSVLPAHGLPHIVFVNFDGALMRAAGNCSDSKTNCSYIVRCPGPVEYPAYGGTAQQRDETLELLEGFYRPFNIRVVTTRPERGDYTMVMVGGQPDVLCDESLVTAAAAGVAPLDCANMTTGENDVVFAFAEAVSNNPGLVAVTIAHEGAHSYGLEHTDNPDDMMSPTLSGPDVSFLDQEMATVMGGYCFGDTQNSFRAMLDAVGQAEVDEMPPVVRFLHPLHGNLAVSYSDPIRIEATDNQGVENVTVVIDQGEEAERMLPRAEDEPGWVFESAFTAGFHTLTAVAIDVFGNQSEPVVVAFFVGGPGVPPPALPEPINPGGGGVGALCRADGDCMWDLCERGTSGDSFCTAPCVVSEQCGDGYSCQEVGFGEQRCAPFVAASDEPEGGCSSAPGAVAPSWLGVLLMLLGLGFARSRPS